MYELQVDTNVQASRKATQGKGKRERERKEMKMKQKAPEWEIVNVCLANCIIHRADLIALKYRYM